jgi:hypothetical protein
VLSAGDVSAVLSVFVDFDMMKVVPSSKPTPRSWVTAAGFQNMAESPMPVVPSPANASPAPTADCSRIAKPPA